jgi:serine phosphatase RsbU (regulator of sigma subunit)
MVGNLLENPIVGFASIFERPKQLNHLNFEGAGVYWWWNYYPELDNPISFCVGTTTMGNTTFNYCESLTKKRYTLGNTNLNVISFRYSYQEFIPEVNSNKKELMDFINVSNLNKTVESTTINFKNNNYLCICMPANHIKDCFILCMYPISEIDYQIEKVRSTIYTVMILLLLISIFTGLLLAKTFITPINELNRGVIALRKRDTETILNIENKDELGHLGQAFNQMMKDIKDMLLAGAVQQCLIPTGKYKMEGYDSIVYNQMATNVGGDYADIFELPNDRVLIVIGDVTGHGVSSSLLTAMVKASVYRFANKNMTLNEIVTKTSKMIADLLNKKKLMTFCAVILDKNTGELSICNAGHPYPIIREKEIGLIRIPNETSFPMGISSKRAKYCSESELLRPEETLFLYTDGFPEAENNKGEIYGYKEFQQLIANSNITSSEELKEYLLKVFREFHGETELADDITFIIVKRKPLSS